MMQPQDMYIWEGMELLCQRRKYMDKAPVNGGVYVVQSWTNKNRHSEAARGLSAKI